MIKSLVCFSETQEGDTDSTVHSTSQNSTGFKYTSSETSDSSVAFRRARPMVPQVLSNASIKTTSSSKTVHSLDYDVPTKRNFNIQLPLKRHANQSKATQASSVNTPKPSGHSRQTYNIKSPSKPTYSVGASSSSILPMQCHVLFAGSSTSPTPSSSKVVASMPSSLQGTVTSGANPLSTKPDSDVSQASKL